MKKIFTLFAATAIAVAANAESTTATFGSANNSEKDNTVICPGFTIDGTYVAGGNAKVNVYGENKGMKMRANKTDNTLILSVDENTTITALVMGVVTNDAEQTLPIIDVLVDGESVALEYPIVTYNTSNADGSAVINLTDIKATETIGLKFDDAEYTAKNKQVFIAGEVTYEEVAEAEPTFPETIVYTINGEKELAGVDVVIEEGDYGPSMSITGESSAEEIAITFAVPEGWDGWIASAPFAEVSEQSIAKTRSEGDWETLEFYLNNQGYQIGNTVTFAVEEEDNYATLALYKGDKVYNKTIDIEYNVVPAGGGDEPSDEPLIPESIGVTTYAEGLTVEQEKDEDDGSIYIDVTGAIEEEEYEVVLDVPEGWDGYVILPFSENITIGDSESNVPGPRKISPTDHDWDSIENALNEGYIKGNKLTLKATGNWEFAYAFLYKGEQFDYNAYIGITAKVCNLVENQAAYEAVISKLDALTEKYEAAVAEIKETNPDFDFSMYEEIPSQIADAKQYAEQALSSANADGSSFSNIYYGTIEEIEGYISMMLMEADPAPEFPSSFDVTLSSNEGVELTTDDSQDVFTINVTGKSIEEEITITVAVPEGFDGFVHISDLDGNGPGINPLSTRAQESEWWPINIVLEEMGGKEGNTLTFPVDGEYHSGQFLLYKHGLVDVNNQINVEFEVEDLIAANQAAYDEVVASIEGVQKEYEVALQEAEEANPDYDFSEWKEIIGGALEQATEGAKQALESANEDGKAFEYAFDVEEFEAMIAEMKKAPIVSENNAAYEKVVADINDLKAKYEEALKEVTEEYPDYDFSEWRYMIGATLDEALDGAEKALYSANDDGVEFNFAFDSEYYVGMIAEMKKAPIVSENYVAYNKVVDTINYLKAEYEAALKELTEEYPDYDFSEWNENIGGALDMAANGAKQALDSANEDGEEFFFPFDSEYYVGMIAEMNAKVPLFVANQEAYDKVIAEIDAVKAEYEKAVSDIETEYPEYDMNEMKEIIEKAISDAETGAEQALYTANEDGEAFFYPFTAEDIENKIAQMKEDAKTSRVNSVNAADNAIYFDLDGNRINNPKAGMYIKVVDGKATKVVIK